MLRLILVITAIFVLCLSSLAEVPHHISYQGKVADGAGQPLATGNYPMIFSFYRVSAGGTAIWSSGTRSVSVVSGLFNYDLGSNVALPMNLTADSSIWLEVVVNGETIAPRTQFSSVGFAIKSQSADTAKYAQASSAFRDVGGSVVQTNPGTPVSIEGPTDFAAPITTQGVNQTASWNVGYGTGHAVYAGHDLSGTGKAFMAERAGGVMAFIGGVDTGLYVHQGSGNAGIFDGNLKVTGTSTFKSISTEGVSQTASWNTGFGNYHAVYAGHESSGTGKAFMAERAGGVMAFIGGIDTGLYVHQGSGNAGIFDGNLKVTGTSTFKSISAEGVSQTASWNTGYGNYHAVYAGHESSGSGKAFMAERAGGVTAFIGGIDTGLYVYQSGLAARFEGAVEVDGNLGVGVSSPDAPLHVAGYNWNVGTTEGDFKIGNSSYRFKVGVAMSGGGAGDVRMRSDGGSSRLILGSGPNDVLAVTGTRVGIGTFTPNYTLDVRGDIGSNTSLYHSDRRWKKNIESLTGSLDKVVQLQGVSFEWNTDEFADMNFPQGKKVGLIAQDVAKVLPEVVSEDADGYKSVEYANLVAVLIEAVKEQQKEIERLRAIVERQ